ncbi:MAG: NAD(P)-binding protein, partial [Chthoniobacterales bacterium]
MTMRYTDRKVAVLGAGLSGTAAAHLLKDEGAAVTVLDSAEEKTILKTSIEGMRARGIEVICGPEAERNSGLYEMTVLSPG